MAPEERTAELYDFLYRDSSRLASYYAQLFGGHLATVEESDTSRKTGENSGAGQVGIPAVAQFSTANKNTDEIQTGAKRVFTPHDLIMIDALASLQAQGKISADYRKARSGALVSAEGTLIFVDRSMLEVGMAGISLLVNQEKKKHRRDQNQTLIQSFELVHGFLEKMPLPSAFLLRTDSGSLIAGTIKESGMEEPIATYYFKHGTEGLSNVHLIGIKEVPTASFLLPSTHLMGAGNQAAKALHDMLFPADSLKVTPLVLFRKL